MCQKIIHSRLKKMKKIIDIVELTLEFNDKIQSGHELKILAPNQMLGRLPVL